MPNVFVRPADDAAPKLAGSEDRCLGLAGMSCQRPSMSVTVESSLIRNNHPHGCADQPKYSRFNRRPRLRTGIIAIEVFVALPKLIGQSAVFADRFEHRGLLFAAVPIGARYRH